MLDRLAEFDMIRVDDSSPPILTAHGRNAYRKIMGRDGVDIPQFYVKLPHVD